MHGSGNAPSGGIEIKRRDELHCDLLPSSKRLVRIGERQQHLISILEMYMVLIPEMFDAAHAADKPCPVHLSELQVLSADANRMRGGRNRHLRNHVGGNEIDRRHRQVYARLVGS